MVAGVRASLERRRSSAGKPAPGYVKKTPVAPEEAFMANPLRAGAGAGTGVAARRDATGTGTGMTGRDTSVQVPAAVKIGARVPTGSAAAAATARPHQFADDPAGGASDMGGDATAASIMNPLRLQVDAAAAAGSEAPLGTVPAPAAVSRVKVAFPATIIDAAANTGSTHAVPPAPASHDVSGDAVSDDTSRDTGTAPPSTSGELPVRGAASHHATIPPPTRGVAFAASPAPRSRRKP